MSGKIANQHPAKPNREANKGNMRENCEERIGGVGSHCTFRPVPGLPDMIQSAGKAQGA